MVEAASSSALKSIIPYDETNHFPLENIPFGAFTNPNSGKTVCCTRIGDLVIDLSAVEKNGLLDGPLFTSLGHQEVFSHSHLNEFMSLSKEHWHEARVTLQQLFAHDSVKMNQQLLSEVSFAHDKVQMQMPVFIRDYTDFYSSRQHAYNVGVMFRGPENALQPNWLHLPVGYHGRASSIVLTGHEVRRPKGQASADQKTPNFTECKRLDFELEVGAFVGKSNKLGQPVKVSEAPDHIFGFCLLNDWSARDLQAWEYVPLGPFNAKNFASTISPWVVTAEALAPFKVKLAAQDPTPLNYLKDENNFSYDVELEVHLKPNSSEETFMISKSNFRYMYWSTNQQLVHHTVTGCNLNVGDLLGSGTISGPEKSEYGSLLELSWGGKEPLQLPNGETRTFLQDGDTLTLKGVCKGNGYTIGFGECSGKILPALDDSNFF